MGFFDRFKRSTQSKNSVGLESADPEFYVGTSPNAFRDRTDWNFQETIEACLKCWRVNPLARRIVNLQTQYVIGEGINIDCQDARLKAFIDDFWNNPLNHMDIRVNEWCDELTRTGNLFILVSSDLSGMSYVRAIPATAIKEIETAENDLEQPLFFKYQENLDLEINRIEADDRMIPTLEPRMLHFTVNRPVGAKWGEPDLAPLLEWLADYSDWLSDRWRLNHYRNSFMWVVKSQLRSESERIQRQKILNMRPPTPGSILVTTDSETWECISPNLESSEAETDGLALKKQIAAGAGIPLHFLAEPETQNKATAEAAGGATYRTYEQRQKVFLWIIREVIDCAIRRRSCVEHDIPREMDYNIIGSDISGKDNLDLSTSAATMSNTMTQMRKLGYVSRNEYMRMVYKYAGEPVDVDALLSDAASDPMTDVELAHFIQTDDDNDARKFNTTTIDSEVQHYDQGAEV